MIAMKTIERTLKKIVIEIPMKDILSEGFDKVWDKIREVYPEKQYDVERILEDEHEDVINITLVKKKLLFANN